MQGSPKVFLNTHMGHLGTNDNLEFAASLLSEAMEQELSLGFVQH